MLGKWENLEMLDLFYWDKLMIMERSVAMLSLWVRELEDLLWVWRIWWVKGLNREFEA